MNPHNHPPKINSVAVDQLPTPRTDAQGYRKTSWVKRSFAKTLERELIASQARERVLREAIQTQIIDSVRLNELAKEKPLGRAAIIINYFKELINHP